MNENRDVDAFLVKNFQTVSDQLIIHLLHIIMLHLFLDCCPQQYRLNIIYYEYCGNIIYRYINNILFCFVLCTYCPFVIISIKLYNYRNLVYCYTCIYLLCVLLNICTLKTKKKFKWKITFLGNNCEIRTLQYFTTLF